MSTKYPRKIPASNQTTFFEAEQFEMEFFSEHQATFGFYDSARLSYGWGVLQWVAWLCVLRVHATPCQISSDRAYDWSFRSVLSSLVEAEKRRGFCLLGVLTFKANAA